MSDYVATTSFADLPISDELRKGISERGYTSPTPVQAAVFAPILSGRDMIVRSKTGTGKTAAFGIPLLERIAAGTRKASALVLCNTRELALQVAQEIEALGKHKDLRVAAIYGGAGMGAQTEALTEGAEIIVGTPGRVYDHIRRGNLKLDSTRIAVLDEADEMLSAGFYEEVTRILDHLPGDRQTLLFSATVPPDIEQLAQKYLRNPETILLSGDVFTVEHIHNVLYHLVDQYPKPRNLLYLIEREDPESAIIFCNLRTDTELVANVLNRNGLDAEMLNGDLPQKERERVMGKVKRGEVRFMVATDIAARGIDISDLSHVLNYSLPEDPAVYLHRVGRTGRIGKKGTAISLVSGAELNTLSALEKKYGIQFEVRKLPTPDEARVLWTEKHIRELRDVMQSGVAFEAFLPLAQDLMSRDDGRVLIAYALRYFFTHHRMEKAQIRAAGEKLLESHQVEKVQKEQKEARRKRDRDHRKPRLEAAPPPARAQAEAPSDRVKLYVEQGADQGWTAETLMSALSELAGRPRETVLAADVKQRYAYVLVRPDASDAYVAASGRLLRGKAVRIEVARPKRSR
ncbi:MAG TPA: DEAD/DEAH box helicase [Myxococcales bacterium]|nr:DEAD/DEAH box helicase [Myxococcales bacterium]